MKKYAELPVLNIAGALFICTALCKEKRGYESCLKIQNKTESRQKSFVTGVNAAS
jgi:hypothetical protein